MSDSTYAKRNSYIFEITNLAKFHFKAFNFRSFLMHFLPISLLLFHSIASHFHFISVSVLLILLFYGFNEANRDIKFQHIFMRCTLHTSQLHIRERIVFFAPAHIMCGYKWVTYLCMVWLKTSKESCCLPSKLDFVTLLAYSYADAASSTVDVLCMLAHTREASYLTFIIALDMCNCSLFMQFKPFTSLTLNTYTHLCSSLAARNVIVSIDCILYQYKLYVNQQNHGCQSATL